ncbi:MAG: hypothetical protein ACLQOZ_01295 [Acidimicrobiales bacterium]|jgi:hypothetical protein
MHGGGNVTVLLVAIGYFAWATWARWRFIALPNRSHLLADLEDIVALTARTSTGVVDEVRSDSVKAIESLLGIAPATTKSVEDMLRNPGLFKDSTWSGSIEEEALFRISAAQVHVPNLLSDAEVVARLVVVRGWLSEYGDKAEFVALGQQIDSALGKQGSPPSVIPRPNRLVRYLTALSQSKSAGIAEVNDLNRTLLGQALVQTYATPGSPTELIWHRKTALILVSGLTTIVLLAFFVNADLILLFGAVGGLLQRLWQLVYERDERNTNPLYWSTLFLAPVAGALAAVGGLYLISFLNITNILGTSVSKYVGFDSAVIHHVGAGDAGVAFLLGFSAQLLGKLAARSTSVVAPAT